MALGKKDRERIAWVKSFRSGSKWFLMLESDYGKKEGTQKNYALALKRFCKYMKMTPDKIIAAYKDALAKNTESAVSEWNDNVKMLVPWAIDKYGLSRSRARDHFSAIKSFFENNSAIGLSAKTPEAHPSEILPVTLDEIRDKILPHADIQERFIVLFLKDCGVSQAEALRFNVGDIEDLGNGFGYMRVFRRKEGVNYETFIGPNATQAMHQYLEYRKREGETITDDSPLLTKKKKLGERLTRNLITYQLNALGKKAGVELSTHRLRKFFTTTLAVAKIHPLILEYWTGHKVKGGRDVKSRYIIPTKEAQLKLYMDAYEHIDISGKSLAELKRRQEVSEALMDKLMRDEPFTNEDRANIKRYGIRLRERVGRPMLSDNADESNSPNNSGCADGKHCPIFKEIGEEELLTHLQDGWTITHNMQTGRVIVQREE
jgi:integrase